MSLDTTSYHTDLHWPSVFAVPDPQKLRHVASLLYISSLLLTTPVYLHFSNLSSQDLPKAFNLSNVASCSRAYVDRFLLFFAFLYKCMGMYHPIEESLMQVRKRSVAGQIVSEFLSTQAQSQST